MGGLSTAELSFLFFGGGCRGYGANMVIGPAFNLTFDVHRVIRFISVTSAFITSSSAVLAGSKRHIR